MNCSNTRLWLAATLCLALCGGQALAADTDQDVGYVTEATEVAQTSEKNRQTASEKLALEKMASEIYEDVLSSPDDVELNFAYANQQIRENNFLGASVTLERILMIDPSLDKIRWYYAVVLYRIGNFVQARQEFEALKSSPELPADVRIQVEDYMGKIARADKRTHLQLRETAGYEYNTNRTSAPSSKEAFSNNVLLGISEAGRKRRDSSIVNITRLDMQHELESEARHQLIGGLTYFLQDNGQVDSLDLESFQMDAGMQLNGNGYTFIPKFYATNTLLSQETFLRTQGGSFKFLVPASSTLRTFAEYKLERQDYLGITESPTGFERAGDMRETAVGFDYVLNPTMLVSFSGGYLTKDAEAEYRAYDAAKVEGSHTWFLGGGQFLVNSLAGEFDTYEASDPNVTLDQRRHEKTLRYRVMYGFPLKNILPDCIDPYTYDISVLTSFEYYRAISNITNYTYRNEKFQVLFSKTFEF